MAEKSPKRNEEFKGFDTLFKNVISVPKAEIDKRAKKPVKRRAVKKSS